MDRYDLETVGAMLATAIAISLNLAFLQADAHTVALGGAMRGQLVLIPILTGVAIGASGLVSHIRRHGRDMVIVDRIWAGALAYLALSAGCSALFQPRFA